MAQEEAQHGTAGTSRRRSLRPRLPTVLALLCGMPSASVRAPAAWHAACSCSRLDVISAALRRFRSFVPAISST